MRRERARAPCFSSCRDRVCRIDSQNKRRSRRVKMKISVATASIAFEERGQETTCDFFGAERRTRGQGGGFPSASSERATHVVGAKAIFSGRQISPGPPTSAPRRRSLGYLISGCAPCRCVCPAARNRDRASLAWCIYIDIYIFFFSNYRDIEDVYYCIVFLEISKMYIFFNCGAIHRFFLSAFLVFCSKDILSC